MTAALDFIDEEFSQERSDELEYWIDESCDEFEQSEYFELLSATEQDCFRFPVDVFFDSAYSFYLVGPGRIDERVINELMLDVIPREISAERNIFAAFSPVLQQFLHWCEDEEYLPDTQAMRDQIEMLALEMVERSQDLSYWGADKAWAMSALRAEKADEKDR